MKTKLKSILNLPIEFAAPLIIVFALVITMLIQGSIGLPQFLAISVIGILISMQLFMGSVVVKSVLAFAIVLYMSSLYTWIVMGTYGYIIQPFLLTVASVSTFLAQTYSKDNYQFSIRSRQLDSSILAIVIVLAKLAAILNDIGLWVAEVIGLNVIVLYIIVWRVLVNNSKKTKKVPPIIIEEEHKDTDNLKYIFISNTLDVQNNKWKGMDKEYNSLPYIYNEVLKAYEEKKYLVIVSRAKTSEIYDIGEIVLAKNKKIPYLYLESKDDTFRYAIIGKFKAQIENIGGKL